MIRPPRRPRAAVLGGLLLAVALALPAAGQETPATAQPTAAEPETPPEPEVIPVSSIAARAEALQKRVKELQEATAAGPESLIETRLPAFQDELARQGEGLEAFVERERHPVGELDARRAEWTTLADTVEEWKGELAAHAGEIDAQLEEVAEAQEVWKRTRAAAREDRAPAGTLEQTSAALQSLDETRRTLVDRRNATLDLTTRVGAAGEVVDTALGRIRDARAAARAALFVRNDAPIWQLRLEHVAPDLPLLRESVAGGGQRVREYARSHPERLAGHLALLVLLYVALRRARRAHATAGENDPIIRSADGEALAHPVAAALLVGLCLNRLIHPDGPPTLRTLTLLFALVPWYIVLRALLPDAFHRPLRALGALTAVSLVYNWTVDLAVFSRLVLLLLLTLTQVWLWRLRRPARLATLPPGLRHGTAAILLAAWLRFVTVAVAVALAAALIGFRALGELGAQVAIIGNLALTSFIAATKIVEALLTVGLGSPSLSGIRMLHNRRQSVLRALSRGLRVGMAALLAYVFLSLIELWEPTHDTVATILTTTFGYGAVQLSLGGILAFVFTLWISFRLAHVVNFVFQEEVVPRVRLAPGVPYALGTFARYGIIVSGFLIAISMMGVAMDRLTILVSALSVGIGFGLQNVVNNFVSGVIMLFERPIRVGDRVQLGDMIGDVTSIGIRASTLRTFDGSDVIVPNGDFISNRVVNWTFADEKRRLVLAVGVKYGTEPERVLAILKEAAAEHPQVLANPAPVALFRAFGESSLDFELRAFTERDWLGVHSDLTVAVNRKLKEAGIEIPFPQRDLHLRGADPAVARTLRGDDEA